MFRHWKQDSAHYSKFILSCMLYTAYKDQTVVLNIHDKQFFLTQFPCQELLPSADTTRRTLKLIGSSQFAEAFFIKSCKNNNVSYVLNENAKEWLTNNSSKDFPEFLEFTIAAAEEKKLLLTTWSIYKSTIEDVVRDRPINNNKKKRKSTINTSPVSMDLVSEKHEIANILLSFTGFFGQEENTKKNTNYSGINQKNTNFAS